MTRLGVKVIEVIISSKFAHMLVLHITHFLQETFNKVRYSISVLKNACRKARQIKEVIETSAKIVLIKVGGELSLSLLRAYQNFV